MERYLVFLLAMIATDSVNSCQFGNDAIQSMYNRFEVFRKTKSFDPTDPTVPLTQYSYYEIDGTKRLAIKIGGDYMVEHFKCNDALEIVTEKGQYHVKDGVILNYKRGMNGEISFEDWSNGKKFGSSLRSIDEVLPNNFEEDYKKVLLDLNDMREKMFDYQLSLSKDNFGRVQLYDIAPFSSGGFYAQYIEDGGGSLSVETTKNHEKDTVRGRISCGNRHQKYNVVEGKVSVDGEPFVPAIP